MADSHTNTPERAAVFHVLLITAAPPILFSIKIPAVSPSVLVPRGCEASKVVSLSIILRSLHFPGQSRSR